MLSLRQICMEIVAAWSLLKGNAVRAGQCWVIVFINTMHWGVKMIRKQTVQLLNLKSYTKTGCNDLYTEINRKYKSLSDFESDLMTNHEDPETLNKIWWVLNYHSEMMDQTRRLRAIVETKLDSLAEVS